MLTYIYPTDWEDPVPNPYELTEIEEGQLKTWIKNKIDQVGKPILIKKAIDYIQDNLLIPNNKHVKDSTVRVIVEQAAKEIGYPGQYRNAITAFADAGSGFVTVTSADHGFVDGNQIEIILTTNYDGVYIISNTNLSSFDIETEWLGDDATGVLLIG